MKKKPDLSLPRFVLPVLFHCCTTAAFGQRAAVKGRVTDDNGQPLPEAAVYVKGTGNGTLAKDDGT